LITALVRQLPFAESQLANCAKKETRVTEITSDRPISTQEIVMALELYPMDRQTPIISLGRSPQRAVRRRWFDRIVGFFLGAFILGTTGGVIGSCLTYSHPLAVTISALWWATYFGCFGANIGALLGLWAENAAAPPVKGPLAPAYRFKETRTSCRCDGSNAD
jgi:hypothetical protein